VKSLDHKESVRHKFDSFCKKVIKNEARNIQKELAYRSEHEKSLESLSQHELEQLSYIPDYDFDSAVFSVLDFDIAVKDTLIIEALQSLSEQSRDIILSYYFLDMTDNEIAQLQNLSRIATQRRRKKALLKLKESMEGFVNE
jgi:DNA-directed RNA polymerase specialized sigma subunit